MLSWIKSLFSEISAGTLLVGGSMALVFALMVALGQIASQQLDGDTLSVASNDDGSSSLASSLAVRSQQDSSSSKSDSQSARTSRVSVMVPVNAIR